MSAKTSRGTNTTATTSGSRSHQNVNECFSSPTVISAAQQSVTSSTCETGETGFKGASRTEGDEEKDGGERGGGSEGDRGRGKGLLWEGEYDEQASAQSFQEALAEWRTGRKEQGQNTINTTGLQ